MLFLLIPALLRLSQKGFFVLIKSGFTNLVVVIHLKQTLATRFRKSARQSCGTQFEKNKSDTLRLIGYLPFEKEQLSDQPFLYSQLIGFLDSSEEGNDDMMRTSSIISIVRGFLQKSHIDDQIEELCQDTLHAADNLPVIKALQEMQKNITIS